MSLKIDDEQIWNDFGKMLTQIDVDTIFTEHLEKCGYKIHGYWHENEYYDEISFLGSIRGALTSASLGITKSEQRDQNWIQLKFSISSDTKTIRDRSSGDYKTRIGEVTLIFDSRMEFLDEKWLINIKSPFVATKKGP